MMRHRSLVDGRGRSRLRLLGLAVLAVLAVRSAGAVAPAAPDDAFVSDYCTSCHNDVSKKGRLDLTGLEFDASDPANLAVWIKVHDRVKAGEMPPRGKARPDADRQKAFVEGLARSIVAAERAALAGEGRAIRRRLNRHEYENALRNLLGVPEKAPRGQTDSGRTSGSDRGVRREKVLVFSGCNSHPATGSLQPVAIGAAVEVTKPSKPSRKTGRMATRRAGRP